MPTYSYRCTACSHQFDIVQKFSDDPLTECPECGSPVRKVFQPVGIVFKGSGWYINDSRKPESTAKDGGSATAKASTTTTTETAKPTPEPAKAAAD